MVVIAGKEYGNGSARVWASRGTKLLSVRAAILESFDRIHRFNLVGMGVLSLQFEGESRTSLAPNGGCVFTVKGFPTLKARQDVEVEVTRPDGTTTFTALRRIDTANEVDP